MNITNMYGNTDILSKALEASWTRNEVISNNIANVDTPNFKRSDVAFESLLEQALASNSSESVSNIEPQIVVDNSSLSYRLDGNNVDIDTEMAYLAENQLKYNALISQVNYSFERLKMVMN
jgi:flagellar basal-body rod protein FlgB